MVRPHHFAPVVLGLVWAGVFACSSSVQGTGEGASSSSSGGVGGGPGDGGANVGPDAAPPACAPLVEEALPASAVAWQGAPRCAADGICTIYPAPTGAPPTRISAAPGGSTWAVSGDAVYSWNGAQGRVWSLDVATDLLAISAVSDTDVWAVGYDSELAHWNGSTWTVSHLSLASALSGVHARASNDVWAVGNFGVVGHFDGATWSAVSVSGMPAFEDVWAAGANDVWAADFDGAVWHYDGSWRKVPTPGSTTYRAVWASGPGDAWAASDDGLVHGSTSALSAVSLPAAGPFGFTAVWGSGPGDVWASSSSGIFHLAGGGWTQEPFAARWFTGRAANDVVAIGETDVRRFDGAKWSDLFRIGFPAMRAAWLAPSGDVWFAGSDGTILRAKNGELRRMTTIVIDPQADLRAVWGSSDGDVWFGGDSPWLFHLSDGKVCRVAHGISSRIGALAGSAANDIWALADAGSAAHFDGAAWKTVPLEAKSIVAFSPTDAWASGKAIRHWDGASWSDVDVGIRSDPMNDFGPLGASGPGDVWTTAHVFLDGTKLVHWDGKTWNVSDTDLDDADAVFVASPKDVWFVDWRVHHFDGNAWTKASSFQRRAISAAIATPSAVWLASTDGSILRRPR